MALHLYVLQCIHVNFNIISVFVMLVNLKLAVLTVHFYYTSTVHLLNLDLLLFTALVVIISIALQCDKIVF